MARIPWRSQAMLKLMAKQLRKTASLWRMSASFRGEWDSTVGQVAEVLGAMTQLPLAERRKAIAGMAKLAREALADDARHRSQARTEAVLALRKDIARLLTVGPPRRPKPVKLPAGVRPFEPESRGTMIASIVHERLRQDRTSPLHRLVTEKQRRALQKAFDSYLDTHKVPTAKGQADTHAEAMTIIALRVIGVPNARAAFNFESAAVKRGSRKHK